VRRLGAVVAALVIAASASPLYRTAASSSDAGGL